MEEQENVVPHGRIILTLERLMEKGRKKKKAREFDSLIV